jgi:hypothetical protein
MSINRMVASSILGQLGQIDRSNFHRFVSNNPWMLGMLGAAARRGLRRATMVTHPAANVQTRATAGSAGPPDADFSLRFFLEC